MNILSRLLLLTIISFPLQSLAQINKPTNAKMVLVCPFEHGSGREPKEAFTWDPPDQKVIMISKVDSNVRSCINATVVKAEPSEDSTYEIVINVKNFFFWYHGVMKPKVKRGDTVSAGQTLGIYRFGTELEFRMYDEDDMKDPRDLLECKVPRAE